MEEKKETNSIKQIKDFSIFNTQENIKMIMPRDVQNANNLLNSQNILNKYTWEEQGESVINN